MNENRITKARYYAVSDIAHRWFAFFEGKTEDLSRHLDIFTPDVRLVHGSVLLLAEGRESLGKWLDDLPCEQGSHFIRSLDVTAKNPQQSEVKMNIGYQMIGDDFTVGGALSEYKAIVNFDASHTASFKFIQKTPRFANPDKVFKESFNENRMNSFISHFLHLMLLSRYEEILELMNASGAPIPDSLIKILRSTDALGIVIENTDLTAMRCFMTLPSNGRLHSLTFDLMHTTGRYLKIMRVDVS